MMCYIATLVCVLRAYGVKLKTLEFRDTVYISVAEIVLFETVFN